MHARSTQRRPCAPLRPRLLNFVRSIARFRRKKKDGQNFFSLSKTLPCRLLTRSCSFCSRTSERDCQSRTRSCPSRVSSALSQLFSLLYVCTSLFWRLLPPYRDMSRLPPLLYALHGSPSTYVCSDDSIARTDDDRSRVAKGHFSARYFCRSLGSLSPSTASILQRTLLELRYPTKWKRRRFERCGSAWVDNFTGLHNLAEQTGTPNAAPPLRIALSPPPLHHSY